MAKTESYYTPVGSIKFPKTKINDKEVGYLYTPKGLEEEDIKSWKFQLVIDPETDEAKDLLAMLDKQHGEIKGSNFVPYKKDMNKNQETGELEETGLVAINFTTSYPITMVDALKNKCNESVGWGSKVKVKFTTKPVNNKGKVGLGRYVRAMQIIELSEAGQDLSGFGEEQGHVAEVNDDPNAQPWDE